MPSATPKYTSFPLFPNLPLELQDLIWSLALPDPRSIGPGAYHVTLVRAPPAAGEREDDDEYDPIFSDGGNEAKGKSREMRFFLQRDGPDGQRTERDVIGREIAGVRCACRRGDLAYRRARRRLDVFKPKVPVVLKGSRYSAYSLATRSVSAVSDLVILQQGWQRTCSLISRGVSSGGFGCLHLLEGVRRVRWLGVNWPGPQADGGVFFRTGRGVMGVTGVWSSLEGFYVVVRPEFLVSASWPADSPGSPSTVTKRDREQWFAQCQAQGESDLFWKTEGRVYREVPMNIVEEAGGLWRAVEVLVEGQREMWRWAEVARGQGVERVWTRCRVVSWVER